MIVALYPPPESASWMAIQAPSEDVIRAVKVDYLALEDDGTAKLVTNVGGS